MKLSRTTSPCNDNTGLKRSRDNGDKFSVKIRPERSWGLANLSDTDCGSNNPDFKQEMEKQFVDLLTEELKLQKAVAEEHDRHMNITFGEAKRVASQYQREAEKCITATETCEGTREQAEALLIKERKVQRHGSTELGKWVGKGNNFLFSSVKYHSCSK